MTDTPNSGASRPAATARQWQRTHGHAAANWIRSSGVAQRMLDDVCLAVEATVRRLVGDSADRARDVLEEYPRVLRFCDQLEFNEPAQALAYLILHLPDRYCRLYQVLERLLLSGRLPMGRSDSFAAIDIGAGPGPGIFAVRNFYVALAHYVRMHDPSWRVATLGHSDVVERGKAMPWVMHHFAESLVLLEQGRHPADDDHAEPNPCASELTGSSTPFGARYDDFTALDVWEEHLRARQRLAKELQNEDNLNDSDANRLSYEQPIGQPSAYALATIMYFLTPGSEALAQFSEALNRLMGRALVPGGTILVLGGTSGAYQQIYRDLDARANAAHLTVVEGFEQRLHAGHRTDELAAICSLTRRLWHQLEALAGDVSPVKDELRRRGAADIFDESVPFALPRFQVRGYRRGH